MQHLLGHVGCIPHEEWHNEHVKHQSCVLFTISTNLLGQG